MRATTWMVFLVMVTVAVAGCSKSPGENSDAKDAFNGVEPTQTRGVIKGVVVDEAIRPLKNASVELKDHNRTAATDADGLFSFADLEPGTYFIQASKYGYNSTLTSVQVEAGIDPPIVSVALIAKPSERPYLEVLERDGWVGCSAGGQLDFCGLAGSQTGASEGIFFHNIEMTYGIPSWIQTELVWDSTQPTGSQLKLQMANETDYYLYIRKNVTGESPLVGTWNSDEIAKYRFGIDSEYGIFVAAPDTGVVVQQRFTAYTHIFYRFSPPEGWLFSRDGNPPIPES